MHTLIILLIGFICMGEVFPRHVLEEVNEPDLLSPNQNDGIRKHTSDQNRHRRRRWQASYGSYDYPPPPPYYYSERRDYDRNQQDLLPQIVRLLEEISTYVKRPQPPALPQPIYIPYPVPYPVPQFPSCSENTTKKPSIHTRFPVMEDTNQNWGFVIDKDDDTDDLSDSRPISFDPIKPLRPMKRPSPKVEHGSSIGDPPSTAAPLFNDQPGPGVLRTPINCNAAIVLCCAESKSQQLCFNGYGCGTSYDNGNACSQSSIQNAVESIKSTFSPVQ